MTCKSVCPEITIYKRSLRVGPDWNVSPHSQVGVTLVLDFHPTHFEAGAKKERDRERIERERSRCSLLAVNSTGSLENKGSWISALPRTNWARKVHAWVESIQKCSQLSF